MWYSSCCVNVLHHIVCSFASTQPFSRPYEDWSFLCKKYETWSLLLKKLQSRSPHRVYETPSHKIPWFQFLMYLRWLDRNYKEEMNCRVSKQQKVSSLLVPEYVRGDHCRQNLKKTVDAFLFWKCKGRNLLATTPVGFHCLLSVSFIFSLSAWSSCWNNLAPHK